MRGWTAAAALAAAMAVGASSRAGAEVFAGRVQYRLLDEQAGLGNLWVLSLLQDRAGFLWAGTENGLYRYDGHEFQAFGREAGLDVPQVVALHETHDGRLFVGLRDGLARREGERFHWYRDLGPVHAYYGGIVSDAAGVVYVATREGLLVGRDGRFTLEPKPAAADRTSVTAVLAAPRGELYLARAERLYRRVRGEEEEIGARLGLPPVRGQYILSLKMDGAGRLFARTPTSLYVLLPGAPSFKLDASLPMAYYTVFSTSLDPEGNLLIPLGRGVGRWSDGRGRLLGTREGLPSGHTTAALADREGSLWVGLGGMGIAQELGTGELTSYGRAEGLSHEHVWSIARAKRRDGRPGALFIGTQEGLNRLDPLSGTIQEGRVAGGSEPYVQTAVAGDDGGVFVSLWPGVARLDPDGAAPRRYGARGVAALEFNVRKLHVRPNREVWAAALQWAYRLVPGGSAFEPVPPLAGFDTGFYLHDFVEGADGSLLGVGDGGLVRLTDEKPRVFTVADGLRSTPLHSIASLPDGDLVVAYKDMRGVSRLKLDGERLVLLPPSGTDRLASSNVRFVRSDAAANLWVGTDKGLDVFYRDGSRAHFGKGDGLVSEDTSQNAFHADPDGTVWIGTSRGLVRYRPRARAPLREPPPIVLTAVEAGRRLLEPGAPARLAADERTLRFAWAGLTFRNPGSLRYRYRLVGLEDELVETRLHEARYAALGPGRYRFEVSALSATGLVSREPAVFAFEVEHLWWEQPWLRAVFALAAAAAAGSIVRWRYQRRVARRTLAAREELRTLRAQLNPHFLFNLLHSLSMLVHEDARSADAAIEHLAAMLRYVLDERTGDEVELAEELAFVDHYLALEALRLGPRLRVSREIDPELIDAPVPPFTLQLLVENAIRHGVARRSEGGRLSLIARRGGARTLELEVRDDGPGATPAAALAGKGLGLRALRQRLTTRYAGRATLEVETAPGQGFAATLRLPLETDAHRRGALA
jgi:ligand-binding sensor domain-containing protein